MRKKLTVAILAILGLACGVILYAYKKADVYHSTDRRAWKNDAVHAIQNNVKDSNHLKKRFGEAPRSTGDFDTSEPKWLTQDTIVCSDGSWMAYRSQCLKEDPKVYDIFIAKASDGKWYYSDFHFCIDMMTLGSNGQPASLDEFKHLYFLHEFDGVSDDALEPTWIPRGELRQPDEEG